MAGKGIFCMIHEGRCGSTVLATLINQHPGVVHFNEILTRASWISPDFVGSDLEARRDAHEIKLDGLNDFVARLSETRKARQKPDLSYLGFEIKLNQLASSHLNCDVPSLVRRISAGFDDVKFMFLTRRNILRRHVSTLRCLYKEVSHAKQISDVNFEKVTVGGDALRDWSYDFSRTHTSLPDLLESSEAQRSAVEEYALKNGHLYLEYEEFEKDPLSGAIRILDFLGLSRIDAETPLLKTGDRPLEDLIENYDEVRDSLKGTSWEPMLD